MRAATTRDMAQIQSLLDRAPGANPYDDFERRIDAVAATAAKLFERRRLAAAAAERVAADPEVRCTTIVRDVVDQPDCESRGTE